MATDDPEDAGPGAYDGADPPSDVVPEEGIAPPEPDQPIHGAPPPPENDAVRQLGSLPDDSPIAESAEEIAAPEETHAEDAPTAEMLHAWLAEPDEAQKNDVPGLWAVGDVILDTYEVKEVITGGNMGTVYRVHHRDWEIDFAIKSVKRPARKPDATDEQDEQRWHDAVTLFFSECSQWIGLGLHPHIAGCFAVQIWGGTPRALIEWVGGGSLDQWMLNGRLYRGGQQAARARILDIAIQVAWGLQYLHGHQPDGATKATGAVHQDVKPANILLPEDFLDNPEASVKVTDFGIAQARHIAQTQAGADGEGTLVVPHAGFMTRAFRSPEQASAGRELITRRSDLWSLALTVVAMFRGGEKQWVLGEHAQQHLDWVRQVGGIEPDIPPLPESLAEFLAQCFRSNADDRPHDMGVFAEEVKTIYEREIGTPYPRIPPKKVEGVADALNNVGVSHLELAKYELEQRNRPGAFEQVSTAQQRFDAALEADPKNLEARYNRGVLRWRRAQITDDALLRELEDAWQERGEDWRRAWLLAMVHLERDDCVAAVLEGESVRLQPLPQPLEQVLDAARARGPTAASCVRTFEGHWWPVNSVALSADGRWALSAGGIWDTPGGDLKLWDVESGRCLRSFEGHTKYVGSVALSADGRWALSGSRDCTVRLWEVETGRCLRTFAGHTKEVYSVALSADAHLALSGSHDQTLLLWEVESGRCLRTFVGHNGFVNSVALSADGRWALSGSDDRTLRLWEVESGRCVRTFEGHINNVRSVALSADGHRALSGSGGVYLRPENWIRLWEVESGRCLRTFVGHTRFVDSVALSADGRWALSGSWDDTVRLWEVESGRCLRTFEGHTETVRSVALSADGRWALSGSADKTLRLWRLGNGLASGRALSHPVGIRETTQAQEAYRHALRAAQTPLAKEQWVEAALAVQRARAQPGHSLAREALDLWGMLASRLPRLRLRQGVPLDELRIVEGHTGGSVTSVALSADGRWALSGSWDGTLRLWEVASARCLRTFECTGEVSGVVLSADRCRALSASANITGFGENTLQLWDVDTGRCLRTFKGNTHHWVTSAALSADGRWALSGGGIWDTPSGDLKLWDGESGRCLRTFEGHTGWVKSAALSADGRWALSGGSDGTLRLWDVESGRCLRSFEGHTEYVASVALSADRRWALSGSGDKTLRLWDVESGRCLRTFEGHTNTVTDVALSADGRWALSGGDKLRLWDVESGRCMWSHTASPGGACALRADDTQVVFLADDLLLIWYLDWELDLRDPADWDEGARTYLEIFLALHTPPAGELPADREPSDKEIARYLTRRGTPTWTQQQFQDELIGTLNRSGYGWLRRKGVRAKLEEMRDEQVANGGVPAAFGRIQVEPEEQCEEEPEERREAAQEDRNESPEAEPASLWRTALASALSLLAALAVIHGIFASLGKSAYGSASGNLWLAGTMLLAAVAAILVPGITLAVVRANRQTQLQTAPWLMVWLFVLVIGLVWFIGRCLLVFAGGIAPGAPPPAFLQWFFDSSPSLLDWIVRRLSN